MIELSSQVTAKTKENILASAHEIVMPTTNERIDSAVTDIRTSINEFSADTQSKLNEFSANTEANIAELSANTHATILDLSGRTSIYDENGVALSANPVSVVSNPEFVTALIDSEGKLLYGIRVDGSVYQCATDDLTKEQIEALRNYTENTIATSISELSADTKQTINAFSADTQYKFQQSDIKTNEFSASTDYRLVDLETQVFPLSVSYARHNSGKFEVGTSVTPTATLNIIRRGVDVASSANVVVSPASTLSEDKKTFSGTPISSGTIAYNVTVTQPVLRGQTKALPTLTYDFMNYRYFGPLASIPTDYTEAIKGFFGKPANHELSRSTTLGETNLAANMYYLFAVKGNVTLKCKHAATSGDISGCITGTCDVLPENNAGFPNTYSYILVPKSDIAWSFKIIN